MSGLLQQELLILQKCGLWRLLFFFLIASDWLKGPSFRRAEIYSSR